MTNRDYYEVLGVSKTATQDEIKKAFKKKAAELHPDVQETGDESAFKELGAAYEVLSDEQKRAMYDRYGADGVKGAGSRFESAFDMGAFHDLSEIFEFFFGGGMRSGGQRRQPDRGNDLRFDVELDFQEAVFGVEKKINIKHLCDCTECSGSGAAPGSKPIKCVACAGMGQVRQTTATLFGHFAQILPCPTCNGEGTKIDRPCEVCKGRGQVKKPKSMEVKIPPGVDEGLRIRLTGDGDQGRRGATPGDLYVVLHVKQHPLFIRDGVTIHLKQPISFSMAALGGELLVETVHGKKILKIPAGTQSGTTMIMRELGVPMLSNPQKKGDQQVHLIVDTPTKLSEEEKQLLKKLAELRGESLTVSRDDKENGQQSLFDVIAGVFKPKHAPDDSQTP